MVGAGLLLRSFVNLTDVSLGFSPEHVMTMTVDLPEPRYPTPSEITTFHRQLLSSLSVLPNVSSAAAVNWLPLGDMVISGDVQAEDRRDLVGKYNATKVVVSPDYFATMGIRLVRGGAISATGTLLRVSQCWSSASRLLKDSSGRIGIRSASASP